MKGLDFYINEKLLDAYQLNKRYTVAYGGRGSGKSFQMGALCVIHAIKHQNSRILAVRGTQNKISESSLQIYKDVIEMLNLNDFFTITENTLKCNNGSEFIFYGAKNYHTFKSLQGISLVHVDEATELSKNAWEVLIPTIREDNSKFLIGFNPEKETDWVYQQFIVNKHPEAVVVKLNYLDNPFFPEVLKKELKYDKSVNLNKYLHVWEGELIKANEGALWKESMIIYNDLDIEYDKVVVAIDPSVTNKSTSDACGVVVVAKKENKYYVLEDKTKILSPNEWANLAISLYDKYEANYIVAETNQGGDLVKSVIRNIRQTIPYKSVRASKGKMARAEPIAALYEQSLVFHNERFPTLEYELLTYTGDPKEASPNSLDALVWGLTELSAVSKIQAPKGMVAIDMGKLRL